MTADPGEAGPGPVGASTKRARTRRLELILAVYAAIVLAIAWAGLAIALTVDPGLPESAWTWLTGTPVAAQVVLWILFLPITVGLWIWTSDVPAVIPLAYGAGLVLWTLTALRSLWRAGRPR
jgi:hypothetical protein